MCSHQPPRWPRHTLCFCWAVCTSFSPLGISYSFLTCMPLPLSFGLSSLQCVRPPWSHGYHSLLPLPVLAKYLWAPAWGASLSIMDFPLSSNRLTSAHCSGPGSGPFNTGRFLWTPRLMNPTANFYSFPCSNTRILDIRTENENKDKLVGGLLAGITQQTRTLHHTLL